MCWPISQTRIERRSLGIELNRPLPHIDSCEDFDNAEKLLNYYEPLDRACLLLLGSQWSGYGCGLVIIPTNISEKERHFRCVGCFADTVHTEQTGVHS